jgi:hypothetical protein
MSAINDFKIARDSLQEPEHELLAGEVALLEDTVDDGGDKLLLPGFD